MTTTTNFGFNIPDGTDNVNLLTQNYPNWTSLDAILKAIKDTGITAATATKTLTNFAAVRSDADCKFFAFVATANYVAGDTFTVDGVPVTATTPAGTALSDGAFVINQTVLCAVNGGVLTVFVSAGTTTIDADDVNYDNSGSGLTATDVQDAIDELKADMPVIPASYAASAITYDNTVSGLTAADVQAAIDELAASINPSGSVTVTADGVKSNATLLNGLYALIDSSKITKDTRLLEYKGGAVNYYYFSRSDGSSYSFSRIGVSSTLDAFTLKVSSSSTYWQSSNLTQTNQSSTVPAAGTIFTIVY